MWWRAVLHLYLELGQTLHGYFSTQMNPTSLPHLSINRLKNATTLRRLSFQCTATSEFSPLTTKSANLYVPTPARDQLFPKTVYLPEHFINNSEDGRLAGCLRQEWLSYTALHPSQANYLAGEKLFKKMQRCFFKTGEMPKPEADHRGRG